MGLLDLHKPPEEAKKEGRLMRLSIKAFKILIVLCSLNAAFFSFVIGTFPGVGFFAVEPELEEFAQDVVIILFNQIFAITGVSLLAISNILDKTKRIRMVMNVLRAFGISLVFFTIYILGSIEIFAHILDKIPEDLLYSINFLIIVIPIFMFLFAVLVNRNKEYSISVGFFVVLSIFLIIKLIFDFLGFIY